MTLGRRPGGRLHARSRVQEDAGTNLIEEAGTAGDSVAVTTDAAVLLERSNSQQPGVDAPLDGHDHPRRLPRLGEQVTMPPHRGQRGLDVGGIVVEVRADPDVAIAARDDDAILAHCTDEGMLVR